MTLSSMPVLGTFCLPGNASGTPAGATPFAVGIPPYSGTQGPNRIVTPTTLKGFAKVTRVIYSTLGGTAHRIGIMRPFNWTTVKTAAAAAQAVINITADPGIISTNWKRPLGITATPSVADDGIAATDYVMYQTADGLWVTDTVASVATLAITMTTNVPTAGVLAGAMFYWFGIITEVDPSTNALNPQTTIAATITRDASWLSDTGVVGALWEGDPLIFYSPNTTNAGNLDALSGIYTAFP